MVIAVAMMTSAARAPNHPVAVVFTHPAAPWLSFAACADAADDDLFVAIGVLTIWLVFAEQVVVAHTRTSTSWMFGGWRASSSSAPPLTPSGQQLAA